MTEKFRSRTATKADIAVLTTIMNASISMLQGDYLKREQVSASFEVMGLDTKLIEDKTYFVILHAKTIVGCGGWSRRATLFGGNHTKDRDDALLDPKTDAARIRAMYTHPDWTRKGIGRRILNLCENAARREGFRRFELAATLSGQPLYLAAGYEPITFFTARTSKNIDVPLVRMAKSV
ncbi:MAG: GNAT family N-acetyltransferase [Alphaproteobacteria bacterium]|nr:MAG: GNAT family N-acetyltransferase [Alphaproteobacteria bacterium]